MNGIDTRTARTVMGGLVAAGATLAAIGATSLEPQVAIVLPPVGAALIAAGLVVLMQAEPLDGRQAVTLGAALVTAGVVAALVGSTVPDVAVTTAVVPVGGALVAGGTIALVSGTAAVSARAGRRAR